MFGRPEDQSPGDEEVAVDATLERELEKVETTIEAYISDPSANLRSELLAGLERLDQQIDQSDAYEGSVIGSGAIGLATKGSVIGETSSASAAEEIPGEELRAQAVLIKAAKQEVSAPTSATLAELREANHALAAVRGRRSPMP
jgi:hypothetical protein